MLYPTCYACSGRVPLGELPDPASIQSLLTFTPSGGGSGTSSVDILADAASGSTQLRSALSTGQSKALHNAGPYNTAAALPPKVGKWILSLEFVEMSELRADI